LPQRPPASQARALRAKAIFNSHYSIFNFISNADQSILNNLFDPVLIGFAADAAGFRTQNVKTDLPETLLFLFTEALRI